MTSHLYLYEQVKLLSMKDDTGLQLGYDMMNPASYSIAGAVLMDLLMGSWITYNSEHKCIVNDTVKPPDDSVLQAALARIRKQKKSQDAKNLILLLTVYNHPERAAIQSLVAKGVVNLVKTGGFFSRKRYPLHNVALKQGIIDSLRGVLKSNEQAISLQTLILFRLIHSAKILPYLFKNEFGNDPQALHQATEIALKKIPFDDGVDAALKEKARREEIFDAISFSLDALTIALDAIADAVDASVGDGGGADGGGADGGGGGD